MRIKFTSKGNFNNTERFLTKMSRAEMYRALERYAEEGKRALAAATPVESGITAGSWGYEIIRSRTRPGVVWTNDHEVDGVPIAIILQYGHGTGTGGYVQGRDYINPAIQPVMDKIADNVWKAVTSA